MALRGRLEEAFALHKKGDREKPGAEITAQNGNAHGPHGVTRKHVFSDKNVNQILAFVLIQSYFKTSFRYGRIAFKSLTAEEVQRQQMNIIALIDTKPELPGETIGTAISTHSTIADAFTANEAF